jgi:1-deoxy-D-xylulose-5-phosphate reductoisomerase
MDCVDMVLSCIVGIAGLKPAFRTVSCGTPLAIANKETLVVAGELIMRTAKEQNAPVLPVDSEHSAIFQCLAGEQYNPVEKLIITASGGSFRGYTRDQLADVKLEQALKHPVWNMGSKITIDSATMMNKGLEVIEARWLFDVPADRIDIHVHPQSIVHSMVEFCDGSVIAQMGLPDMKIPISLALNYPDRMKLIGDFDPEASDAPGAGALDLFTTGANLTFEKPDRKVFRCIDLAYTALKEGGAAPVVMNGANEALVAMFLSGKIGFLDIPETIEKVMDAADFAAPATVDEILHIDREARRMAAELL